jgi:hypothetical protein
LSTEILGELHMTIAVVVLEPTDISLRVFSLVQLYTAIYLRGDLFDTVAIGGTAASRLPHEVPADVLSAFHGTRLRLIRADVKVHYSSAISLGLGTKWGRSADSVAAAIVTLLANTPSLPQDPHAVSLQVEIRSTETGQIAWEWHPANLLIWLHHAARSLPQLPWISVTPDPAAIATLWPALQAYARLHTWLDRATPSAGEFSEAPSMILDPLDAQILVELMQIIDTLLDCPMPAASAVYIKLIHRLEQHFRELERTLLLVQAERLSGFRLGLVILMKNLLECLLTSILGQKVAKKI